MQCTNAVPLARASYAEFDLPMDHIVGKMYYMQSTCSRDMSCLVLLALNDRSQLPVAMDSSCSAACCNHYSNGRKSLGGKVKSLAFGHPQHP